MDINSSQLRANLITLQSLSGLDNKQCETFVRLNREPTVQEVKNVIGWLSQSLLDPKYTESIGECCSEILLLLVSQLISSVDANQSIASHRKLSIALSKLLIYSQDVVKCSYNYFATHNEPFKFESTDYTPKRKKLKNNEHSDITDLDIVICCYNFLRHNVGYFKNSWRWSQFIEKYWDKGCIVQRLYCQKIMALLMDLSDCQQASLKQDLPRELLMAHDKDSAGDEDRVVGRTNEIPDKHTCSEIALESDTVLSISGIMLPIFNVNNFEFYKECKGSYETIVQTESTRTNLRSLALGVFSEKAVCLSGPVGSGKTTLVEYLARKTGRVSPKPEEYNAGGKQALTAAQHPTNGFLRIQLGDQTDGKMLLGQYRCTDVPGEFSWQPGVLTQAVLNGYWLLLEDLDSATQDVCNILTNLLENNYLSVPGFRDCVRIEPGFQMFVTIRTQKNTNSMQQSVYSLLEKHLYTVTILPLSQTELGEVICENYPKLRTVAVRIVNVFLTFSSGCHDADTSNENQENGDRLSLSQLPNSGRLVSTRDLIKLCRRSDPTFSVTSTECAYFVFQNAVDLFCSHLPEGKVKTQLVTSIGAKLGIIKSRCEFLSDEYKPDVSINDDEIKVGRVVLQRKLFGKRSPQDDADNFVEKKLKLDNSKSTIISQIAVQKAPTFAFTRLASCILERISVALKQNEPVLLVGETGVGKTSSVQYLSYQTHKRLVVVNMNNQSDVADLVGGFKPVDMSFILTPLRNEFEFLFKQTFNVTKNEKFLNNVSICMHRQEYNLLVKLMLKIVDTVFNRFASDKKSVDFLKRWEILQAKLTKINSQLSNSLNLSFAFITGALVNCIKDGNWILLDEINLASSETLECLSTILEPNGSIVLLEKGDFVPVKRHPDFRIFACMNPNTDIGKKDLPVGIRNRFTEFFVDELKTENDLMVLVGDYLSNTGILKAKVFSVVRLYRKLRSLAQLELNDGLGNRPVYSLRTLCRALNVCAKNMCGSIDRNLYESFCLSFLTQLDPVSHNIVLTLIQKELLSNTKAILSYQLPKPNETDAFINFEGYWIECGGKTIEECPQYILTDSIKANLKDLARIVSIGKLPVLLQGPTSAGKTSLIEYVAKMSGNFCLRINNHEHTDLQEYIGTYATQADGKLVFTEGVLVQAMKNGYWIILDELNLAPSDILEALNRVLDDNRELFIPETQTVVKAHSNFMLFATQNPPGLYGGRKTLSRAFKNRFIELHFSEIPRPELEVILEKRCLIPKSFAQKMVKTMFELQMNRKSTTKNNFTLRDLFRWGNRYTNSDPMLQEHKTYDWNQHLVDEGYLVLSAKVRSELEKNIIEEALFNNFRKQIVIDQLFTLTEHTSLVTRQILQSVMDYKFDEHIVWTLDMRRMAVLVGKSLQFDEPVLLVGPTGCGKTTICQILAHIGEKSLRILNCHMHTEGADFLGGLRPYRDNNSDETETCEKPKTKQLFEWANGPLIYAMQEGGFFLADEISLAEDSVLERLNCVLEPERSVLLAEKGGIGEITLDAEGADQLMIKARKGFQFLATMNPGGDFGKKELSPALRNRFTEIWCKASDNETELIEIAAKSLKAFRNSHHSAAVLLSIAKIVIRTVYQLRKIVDKFSFSIRDVLAWVMFIVENSGKRDLPLTASLVYGLETMFLDSLEMLPHQSEAELLKSRNAALEFLENEIRKEIDQQFCLITFNASRHQQIVNVGNKFGIDPFFATMNPSSNHAHVESSEFMFTAPTTCNNLFRLLAAISLRKPILLEGPPGVGKTSIVENLCKAIGNNIVRINLCEHTDLADLFGTDLPDDNSLESDSDVVKGQFVWRDGPLLAALKSEHTWILLDELNLAPQSVLEGLNAILDHRGEVFIPELNRTFTLGNHTRVFASQNPLRQGGGRKGLPQSFLNRFTKVYLKKLNRNDLLHVVNGLYKDYFGRLDEYFVKKCMQSKKFSSGRCFFKLMSSNVIEIEDVEPERVEVNLPDKLVRFSQRLDDGLNNMEFGYKGGPFEVNLRDILRLCELLSNNETGYSIPIDLDETLEKSFETFLLILFQKVKLVYCQRMRTEIDRKYIIDIFGEIFECDTTQLEDKSINVGFYFNDRNIFVGDLVLSKRQAAYSDGTDIESVAVNVGLPKKDVPIILASQIETVKNIAESVLIEKPVLMCGPTDSGKTKCIDVFCTMTNASYIVDTIDESVTGSFQQVDLNRHLEEIAMAIHSFLIVRIQSYLLKAGKEGKQNIIGLMMLWEDYCTMSANTTAFFDTSALSAELVVFKKRLVALRTLLKRLETVENITTCEKNILDIINKALTALHRNVISTETLNTGGRFEWVDSKIVKSLKSGQYICLEHVNLCSPAILDRLNPVFEPNGSLLISEKGVNKDNCQDVVGKHKNFRAFLTLDPKHGDISRAMRNRCLEISLNRNFYSNKDLRLIICEIGVTDNYLASLILRIHRKMVNVSEFSPFSISHVTKFAFLVAANKRMKLNDKETIYSSAVEVYVRSTSVDVLGYGIEFYRSKLTQDISSEIETITPSKNIIDLQKMTIKTDSMNSLALVKLQCEPFLSVLRTLVNENISSDQLNDFFVSDLFSNQNWTTVKYMLASLYENCSVNDLLHRKIYINRQLRLINATANEIEELLRINESLFDVLSHWNFNKTRKDIPWNKDLYSNLRVCKSVCMTASDQNRLRAIIIRKIMTNKAVFLNTTKLKQLNAITYSNLVDAKTIADSVQNEFITNLCPLIKTFPEYMRSALMTSDSIKSDTFEDAVCSFAWINRLLKISEQTLLKDKQLNENLMDQLTLHFHWLQKHCIKNTNFMQLKNSDDQESKAFVGCFQKISHFILSNKHPLSLKKKLFVKTFTNFTPFYEPYQIMFEQLFDEFIKLISPIRKFGVLEQNKQLLQFTLIQSPIYVSCKNAAFDCLASLNRKSESSVESCEDNQFVINETIQKNIEIFEKELHHLKEFVENDENHPTICSSFSLQMCTLEEYFGLRAINGLESITDYFELNSNYFRQNKTLNPRLTLISAAESLKKWKTFLENSCHTIEDATTVESFCVQYKNLNTYHRKLSQHIHDSKYRSLVVHQNLVNATFSKNPNDTCSDEEVSLYGPTFINTALKLMLNAQGELIEIGLGDFNSWKVILNRTCQLLWGNIEVFNGGLQFESDFYLSTFDSKKLLIEMKRITAKCQLLENDNFTDFSQEYQQLVEMLSETYETASLAKSSLNVNQKVYYSSVLHALVGIIELNLISYLPLLDPVEKNRLKKEYIEQDIEHVKNLMQPYRMMQEIMNYKYLGSSLVDSLQKKLNNLDGQNLRLQKKVAIRPAICLYSQLVKDINHFLYTCCHPKMFLSLIRAIVECLRGMAIDIKTFNTEEMHAHIRQTKELSKRLMMWINNTEKFEQHILVAYLPHYSDFLDPIKCAIARVRHGLIGLRHCLLFSRDSIKFSRDVDVTNLIQELIEYPFESNEFFEHSDAPIKNSLQAKLNVFDTACDKIDNKKELLFTWIRSRVAQLRNTIILAADINHNIFNEFDSTLNVANQIWQKEEDLKRKKQTEEDSLYVTKTRCETEDEEKIILDEIEILFPNSIDDDFGEFLQNDTLEQRKVPKSNAKQADSVIIKIGDLSLICHNFIDVMEKYSRCYYYQPNVVLTESVKNIDFVAPIADRLRIFTKLFDKYKLCLTSNLDERGFISIGLIAGLSREHCDDLKISGGIEKNYNFYKDSNVPEMMSCSKVLHNIITKVDEQLEQWPDHATLIDLKQITKRILSLPSQSPLLRFNVGFQLLRQKLDEWNSVAHINNNFRDLENEVADYVQRWTKLELQCWRECLTQTEERVQSNSYKFIFHIYNIVHEYLASTESDGSTFRVMESSIDEKEDAADASTDMKTIKLSDVANVLRRFVESSSYGEFNIRMRLLKSFELYLQYIQINNKRKKYLLCMLHNMHFYYQQFKTEIDESIKSMRTPIEKKLKDLVKIESYNKDLSYFSMRSNVAKVHRNLHKFSKEFEKVLKTKIAEVLKYKPNASIDLNMENDKGKNLRHDAKVKYYMIDVKNFLVPQKIKDKYPVTESCLGFELLAKAPKLFVTSRNIVKNTILHCDLPALIFRLDTFLTEQIETCDYLRKLEVDRSQEKAKQKSQAKQILNQKKTSLAECFKNLAKLGLSYRAGMLENTLNNSITDLEIEPFSIKDMLNDPKYKKLDQNLMFLNENVDLYFAKCMYKLKLLQNILLQPNAELGLQNLERLKGFAIDFFVIVQNQRKSISKSVTNLYHLRNNINDLIDLNESVEMQTTEPISVRQCDFNHLNLKYLTMRTGLCKIRNVFGQYELFLRCAPHEMDESLCALKRYQNLSQQSETFKTIVRCTEHILAESLKMQTDLNKLRECTFKSDKTIAALETRYADLLTKIAHLVEEMSTAEKGFLIIGQPIVELNCALHSQYESLSDTSDSVDDEGNRFTNVDAEIENTLHSILISMQKLYKKYAQVEEANSAITDDDSFRSARSHQNISKNDEDKEEFEEIQENHLKAKIDKEIVEDLITLQVSKVCSKLETILRVVQHSNPCAMQIKSIQKLVACIPILQQYAMFVQYYLVQQFGQHRLSTKMLSVMLSVFIELGSKGFCIPQDLMQDEEKESKEDKKGEGFGLEDGTGEKDASEKVESEDQLEEAKKPEDYDNSEEKEDPDCKEEKGIEMSEDFDSKLQDLDKKPDDENNSDDEDDDEDPDKQMGETEENAEKLDDQIWGSDEEKDEDGSGDDELNDEQDGKGSGEGEDLHNEVEAGKEKEQDEKETGLDAVDNSKDERKTKENDIDKMQEPEMDEEQNNPYHNDLPEPPEAEPMDLGDMDGENDMDENQEQQDDANPFDIDTMKEQNVNPDDVEDDNGEENDENADNDKHDQHESDLDSSDEDPIVGEDDKTEQDQNPDDATEEPQQEEEPIVTEGLNDEEIEENKDKEEKTRNDETENHAAKDQKSIEDNVEAMPDVNEKGSTDQVQNEKNSDMKQDEELDAQDTGEDKQGVGQAQNEESKSGHQGIAETKETKSDRNNKKDRQEKRKQGHTNEERTLGERDEKTPKHLKTLEQSTEDQNNKDENNEDNCDDDTEEADEHQHVKEPKKSDKVTLDNATEEQSKMIQHRENVDEKETDENEEESTDQLMPEEEELTEEDLAEKENINSEKNEQKSKKPSRNEDKLKEKCETVEKMDVEGEQVETTNVSRGVDTTAHLRVEVISDAVMPKEPTDLENLELRQQFSRDISSNRMVQLEHADFELWQVISSKMLANARDLCEQLRLILEPTKCTRLKGDYRTGRRINMKKIIPYIASQFRKDKIWLRRTKPAQRDYKITIAIDDSKSMHHNNSKELTLQAISLVSQALKLLESGRLSIMSFGESSHVILNHNDQFDGPKLVKSLNFAQNQSKIAELLDFNRTANQEDGGGSSSDNGLFENLLLVLSDGRNIFSEGEQRVKNAVKLARLQRIFIVYIIIDNPENKHSILDIRVPEFSSDRKSINMKSYLDTFPFPYYVIVRDLGQLPLVLSDAMRQWFELVNSEA